MSTRIFIALAFAVSGCAASVGDMTNDMPETGEPPASNVADDVCEIVWDADDSTAQITMSADQQQVTVQKVNMAHTYSFDAEHHWVRTEYSASLGQQPTDYQYDERGHLTVVSTLGTPAKTCSNEYDGEDRVTRRLCNDGQYDFTYDAAGRIGQYRWTAPGQSALGFDLVYDAEGRALREETDSSTYAYAYDSEDHLVTRERDWVWSVGKDGAPDIRWTWVYGRSGGVVAYEQDGTDHGDDPFIDGMADFSWSFSTGCDAIGAAHPWIYNHGPIVDIGQPMPPFPF